MVSLKNIVLTNILVFKPYREIQRRKFGKEKEK